MSEGTPPEGAVCWEDECTKPATCRRVTGIEMGAPDYDGMPDPDGFTWRLEWVCADHGPEGED